MADPFLVLASTSPRRRELLALGGWKFETHPADVDETQYPGEAPGSYVLRLAESKARSCAASYTNAGTNPARNDPTILAADTAVVDGTVILGKPKDRSEAVEMLRCLRGRTHQVFTGIAIMKLPGRNLAKDLCVTDVPMRTTSDEEIDAYVASGDPLDKAGAYAIQHPHFHPVEMMSGCYASVMGLPLCHFVRTLRQFDIHQITDVSAACQSNLNYTCPISAKVLQGETSG